MDFMRNLREETVAVLQKNGKKWADVVGVCGDDFQITKEQFWELANKRYDSGYGGNEVAMDLKIVGSNFWLERHEYDGAEWWEYSPASYSLLYTLFCRYTRGTRLPMPHSDS